MTVTLVNSPTLCTSHSLRIRWIGLLCATALLSGCGVRRRPAVAWSTAVLVRPVLPLQPRQTVTDPLDGAPDLQVELNAPPRLSTPRRVPPAPRLSLPSGYSGDNHDADVLLLAPQLSAQETAAAQRETSQSISLAEKNLASIRGRSLSPAQADLASKARGFVADAKDAARAGDWDRARGLAKKAQVLSQDLISGF